MKALQLVNSFQKCPGRDKKQGGSYEEMARNCYGSSYGQAVGQQQYDAYLQRLNDVLPTLYGQAFDVYNAEGDRLQREFALAGTMRDTEYQQFRDEVGDQQYADAWALQQAESRGQYGDFGGYADLYGDDAADKMRLTWASANPDAAYTAGTITAEEYYMLTGAQPRDPSLLGAGGNGGGPVNYWQALQNTQTQHGREVAAEQIKLNEVLAAHGANTIKVDGISGRETLEAAAYAKNQGWI
jgi:hypothetical protein